MSFEAAFYLPNAFPQEGSDLNSPQELKMVTGEEPLPDQGASAQELGKSISSPQAETVYTDNTLPNEERHSVTSAPKIREPSDDLLLSSVGEGDKEALAILFRRYRRAVLNVAWRILKDAGEAEDLCQDVFLFVFKKAGLFDRTKGTASSWIIQITYHRAINRRHFLEFRQHYVAGELTEEQTSPNRPQLFIDRMDARAILNRLRGQLSAEQQQTLELHFFEGYSLREVAEKTNQTLGNTRNHYYRGLERLRSNIFPEKNG